MVETFVLWLHKHAAAGKKYIGTIMEATGKASQHIARKYGPPSGYSIFLEQPYDEFKFLDKKVFAGLDTPSIQLSFALWPEGRELDFVYCCMFSAVARKRLMAQLSSSQQLHLYALFKVANDGPSPSKAQVNAGDVPKKSALRSPIEMAKEQAYNKLSQQYMKDNEHAKMFVIKDQAQEDYLKFVESYYPNWRKLLLEPSIELPQGVPAIASVIKDSTASSTRLYL